MKKPFFLAIASILISTPGHTDGIGGVVIDDQTRVVQPGVEIDLFQTRPCKPQGQTFWRKDPFKTTVTDDMGSYSFECLPDGTWKVVPRQSDNRTFRPVERIITVEPCTEIE